LDLEEEVIPMRDGVRPSPRCTAFTILALVTIVVAGLGQSVTPPAQKPASLRTPKRDGDTALSKAWLDEDVIWIITAGERAAFKLLQNDEERDQFIDAFWARRNPTPDTFNNEFQVEHYRRIAYANAHFGARIAGWGTDRGHVYIVYGPPDRIDSYPLGKTGEASAGAESSWHPLEVWKYSYLEGVGADVVIEFVDPCSCGDYQMKVQSELKNALFATPEDVVGQREAHAKPGEIQLYIMGQNPPPVRFKDLEEKAITQLKWKTLPFDVTTEVIRATELTSLVLINVDFHNRDLAFVDRDGSSRATVRIFGSVTTLAGRVTEIFEEAPEIGPSIQSQPNASPDSPRFAKTLALRKGRYRIEIAAEDASSHHWGTLSKAVVVGD
jgi:GWxTD domain-containing protein